ncbi:MAG: LysR family transcriptional regulator [Caldilineaceae bacterium]|nr:LysR family transcriptional regulator [Caldilineaceae bacterium]
MQPNLIRKDPRLLRSLQCFEAVARLGSLAAAADELGITVSAISHQLRTLGEQLGEKLIEKQGRRLALTPKGRDVAEQLRTAFRGIENMVSDVVGQSRQTVRVAVCSSFGPAWLVPRMGQLRDALPDLSIELRLYADQPELTHEAADAFVTAEPVQPGYYAIALFEEMLVCVEKPVSKIRTGKRRLISTDVAPDPVDEEWRLFCRNAGIEFESLHNGEWLNCSHYLLAIEMAKSGLGTALVPEYLAESALRSGELARLCPESHPSGRTYNFCCKVNRSHETALRRLARWMRSLRPQVAHLTAIAAE